MSIIDNAAHSVVAYDPKTTKAFTGQRLSKVQYKTVTDKESPLCGIKRPSMCVSLPPVAPAEVIQNISLLAPHVVVMLHGVQDKMIKEMIESGQKSITQESISIASMLEWMEVNNDSGRITKESVAQWFEEAISENLAVVLADKMGVGSEGKEISTAESDQIMKAVGAFKDRISALAGGKTSYEPKVAESLKKCLALAEEGDVMKARFVARLDKMIEDARKAEEMIDLL